METLNLFQSLKVCKVEVLLLLLLHILPRWILSIYGEIVEKGGNHVFCEQSKLRNDSYHQWKANPLPKPHWKETTNIHRQGFLQNLSLSFENSDHIMQVKRVFYIID